MKKVLYTKIGNGYYPMKRLEWEENDAEDAKVWQAVFDDEIGELVWEEMPIIEER